MPPAFWIPASKFALSPEAGGKDGTPDAYPESLLGGVGAELEDRRVLEEGAGEGRVVRPHYLREEVVGEELEDH